MHCPKSPFLRCRIRRFSTTFNRATHYETLGLQEGASKSQIKSHFYKLSKQHHPDVSKDPTSGVLFQKASEAYSVLSNDRERRAYDRSLLHRAPPHHNHAYHPRSPASRAARATHAWETPPRGTSSKPPPDYVYTPPSSRSRRPPPSDPQPYSRPSHIDILTGTRKREEAKEQELDKIRNQMMFVRPLQVVSALFLGACVIFGFVR